MLGEAEILCEAKRFLWLGENPSRSAAVGETRASDSELVDFTGSTGLN